MDNIGYAVIWMALIVSVYSTVAFGIGAGKDSRRILKSARNGLISVFALLSVAVITLLVLIFSHNFSYEYVASYSSHNTSFLYLLSALWAGNSGSLLFWAWLLSLFAFIVTFKQPQKGKSLIPWASMILMLTEVFFLLLLVSVTDPFGKLAAPPADGYGLNPLLQNLGMVFHPPALLGGYVAFSVPFAFGIASLITSRNDDEWLIASRHWALLAWLLLGIGNIIGMWWAYVELGWGGYWAWDPVENAGLMPWLVGTAFLHASIIQRRKGTFRIWSQFLIILTFILVIFGTFLSRSGILSSVHAYSDTGMAPYFIGFIVILVLGSFSLLYLRSDFLKKESSEPIISRENSFLLTIGLFLVSTFVILLGTVYPILREAFTGSKLSLNASFFSKVNGPLFFLIILLIGLCTVIGWKYTRVKELVRKFIWPLAAALIVEVILLVSGVRHIIVDACGFILVFAISNIVLDTIRAARVRHKVTGQKYPRIWLTLAATNTQRYGGYIVHAGIVLMALGIIASSFFSTQTSQTLSLNQSLTINQYTLKYQGLTTQDSPEKTTYIASLSVYQSGKLIKEVNAEKYLEKSQQQAVTEVAIRSTLKEDLYIILEDWSNDGSSADFKVLVNPMVIWIWIGGGIFLLGGLITFWPSRRTNIANTSNESKQSNSENTPEKLDE